MAMIVGINYPYALRLPSTKSSSRVTANRSVGAYEDIECNHCFSLDAVVVHIAMHGGILVPALSLAFLFLQLHWNTCVVRRGEFI